MLDNQNDLAFEKAVKSSLKDKLKHVPGITGFWTIPGAVVVYVEDDEVSKHVPQMWCGIKVVCKFAGDASFL